jgi:hypothetical protein
MQTLNNYCHNASSIEEKEKKGKISYVKPVHWCAYLHKESTSASGT